MATPLENLLSFIENNFDITVDDARIQGWIEELESGTGRDMADLRSDILLHVVGDEKLTAYVQEQFDSRGLTADADRVERIVGEFLTDGRQFNEFQTTLDAFSGGGTGGTSTGSGFYSGGTLTRINRADNEPLWAMTFMVQGIQHVYTFDSEQAMKDALGDDAVSSGKYGFMTLNEDTLNDGNTWVLGDAAMFAGQEGSYNSWFDAAMQEAALEAGVRNPGKIGEMLSDPEIQRIMAEGSAGGWSSDRIQAEIRNTSFYQDVMYPGIKTFLDQGVPNPESSYINFMGSVEASLAALGYERDDDGTYRTQIGLLLAGGISADDFNTFAPVFVRAEQSPEFMATLNKWTEQDLGVTLDFENWFDVLDGNATPDIAAVVEKAQLSFAAERTGTTLSDATITRLAQLTNVSEDQMRVSFNQAEESLLAIGTGFLERFGLTEQALVSSAFGIESAGIDPLSTDGTPFTAAEIRRRALKARTELGLEDDRKANFFVGFDPLGRPRRSGLAASAPEAG